MHVCCLTLSWYRVVRKFCFIQEVKLQFAYSRNASVNLIDASAYITLLLELPSYIACVIDHFEANSTDFMMILITIFVDSAR